MANANDTQIMGESELEADLRAAFLREMGTELAFRTGEIEGSADGAVRVAMRVFKAHLRSLPHPEAFDPNGYRT